MGWATLLDNAQAGTGQDPPWFAQARREGAVAFNALGWPTARDEAFKYTSLQPVAEGTWQPAPRLPSAAAIALAGTHCASEAVGGRLVFINGWAYEPLCSLPPGVSFTPLRNLLGSAEVQQALLSTARTTALGHLHQALVQDGAVLKLAADVQLLYPVELVFVGHEKFMAHTRIVVEAGVNSQCCLVERHVSATAPSLTHMLTHFNLAQGAQVEHVVVQNQGAASYHLNDVHATVGRDAQWRATQIVLGAALARHSTTVSLQGAGAGAFLAGLYRAMGNQHLDMQVVVEHKQPHGRSTQLYKGLIDDHGTGVFGGAINVHPNAQKTDARQLSRSVLLSPTATAHTRPQLEILADDVACVHGATVGQLDPDALFYLRSRGLDAAAAQRLLTYAFAAQVVQEIANPQARRRAELSLQQEFDVCDMEATAQ